MSEYLNLKITSPNGDIFSGQVVGVSLRGIEGELAILAGHIPFITKVKEGTVSLHMPDGSKKEGNTKGGLLSVSKDGANLLLSNLDFE